MKTQELVIEIEVSVVMPCLNEQGSIGTCIEKAQQAMKDLGLQGEVIVADNGSTDKSVAIAKSLKRANENQTVAAGLLNMSRHALNKRLSRTRTSSDDKKNGVCLFPPLLSTPYSYRYASLPSEKGCDISYFCRHFGAQPPNPCLARLYTLLSPNFPESCRQNVAPLSILLGTFPLLTEKNPNCPHPFTHQGF